MYPVMEASETVIPPLSGLKLIQPMLFDQAYMALAAMVMPEKKQVKTITEIMKNTESFFIFSQTLRI